MPFELLSSFLEKTAIRSSRRKKTVQFQDARLHAGGGVSLFKRASVLVPRPATTKSSSSLLSTTRPTRIIIVRDPYLTVLEHTDRTDEFSETSFDDLEEEMRGLSGRRRRRSGRRNSNSRTSLKVVKGRRRLSKVNDLDLTHHTCRAIADHADDREPEPSPLSEYQSWEL